jgi:phosphoserine phosphatase RsbU/P
MRNLEVDAPRVVDLQPGDLLLLITDGFFEWANTTGEEFGTVRASETIRSVSHLTPEEIIAELYNAVLAFSNGSKQRDDLTAVVIKRVPVDTAADYESASPRPRTDAVCQPVA